MLKKTKEGDQDFIRFALRIPQELHASLQKSAEKNRRSLNSEILTLLEISLGKATSAQSHHK